jgi:hypothetical protein
MTRLLASVRAEYASLASLVVPSIWGLLNARSQIKKT